MLYGAIEAGGTKFNCAVGSGHNQILQQIRIETTSPEETLQRVLKFFDDAQSALGKISALGLASFGPLGLDPQRAEYGHILSTPKRGWSHTNLVKMIGTELRCPIALDTDVNAAALAEYQLGAGRGLNSLAYVTVGTGIGGGMIHNGRLHHGFNHPELGHMLIPQPTNAPTFSGCCPYHGACLEGLASGNALAQRWSQPAETLPANHVGWDLEADHLACLCVNLTVSFAPQRIVLGGSVMKHDGLLQQVRQKFDQKFSNYLPLDTQDKTYGYIVSPELGDSSGIFGAFLMAENL